MKVKKITEISSVVIKEKQGKFLTYFHRLNNIDLMLVYITSISKDKKGEFFYDAEFGIKHHLKEFKESD